jgi:hypothetical protein
MPMPIHFPQRWISALINAACDGEVNLPDGFTARRVPNTQDLRVWSPTGKVMVRLTMPMALPTRVVWQSGDYPTVEAARAAIGKWAVARKQALSAGGEG